MTRVLFYKYWNRYCSPAPRAMQPLPVYPPTPNAHLESREELTPLHKIVSEVSQSCLMGEDKVLNDAYGSITFTVRRVRDSNSYWLRCTNITSSCGTFWVNAISTCKQRNRNHWIIWYTWADDRSQPESWKGRDPCPQGHMLFPLVKIQQCDCSLATGNPS